METVSLDRIRGMAARASADRITRTLLRLRGGLGQCARCAAAPARTITSPSSPALCVRCSRAAWTDADRRRQLARVRQQGTRHGQASPRRYRSDAARRDALRRAIAFRPGLVRGPHY